MKLTDKEKLEKLKKLADAMYYAAQHLTTDASRLHKAMEEYHQFIINEYHKEESVSDLEEAATSFARKDSEGISNPANFYYTVADKARIFKAGANWKEQQLLAKIEKMPSVWHNSNTIPATPDNNHLWVVVSFKNGDIRTCFIDTLVTWQRVQREVIDCWAYREDLLKL